MRRLFILFFACVVLVLSPVVPGGEGTIHAKETFRHDLEVILYPSEHRFSAKDTITVPDSSRREFHFLLHRGLRPASLTPGVIISREKDDGQNLFESYRARLPEGQHSFTLEYKGVIYHPLEGSGQEQARGIDQTPGMISEQGVYLAGSSFCTRLLMGRC